MQSYMGSWMLTHRELHLFIYYMTNMTNMTNMTIPKKPDSLCMAAW